MQRVMIVGGPGAGKSTLARALGTRTGLPVHHMDKIHWLPGWVERSAEEKDRLTREVHAGEAWILEGGHSRTYPERMARADTLIWLDLWIGLRILRIIGRSWRYRGQARPDLTEGCPEVFGRQTLDLLLFALNRRRRSRVRWVALFADPPADLTLVRLCSARAVSRYLAGLGETG